MFFRGLLSTATMKCFQGLMMLAMTPTYSQHGILNEPTIMVEEKRKNN